MLKKLLLILVGVGLTLAGLGIAGFAYAQTVSTPEADQPDDDFPFGFGGGMRGSRGGMMPGAGGFFPGGMTGFAGDEDEEGPLHDYIFPAVAEAFDLNDDQIAAFELVQETMRGLRADLTVEEANQRMQQALTVAVEAALEDGVITEDQAENWLDRLENMNGTFPGMMWTGRFPGARRSPTGGLAHEYFDAALANALDVSVEELQAMREDDGFNLKAYADDQGWSDEELKEFVTGVYTDAINTALEDGAITQEQADWLLERLENSGGRLPFGPGRGPRGRWNNGN